tara:strand:+ start:503 stop:1351 length:849 start_codon:yes stop_codon:yes gene_type:complete
MILIADSGSTKCNWVLCDLLGNIKKEFLTIGFNPYFIDKNSIIDTLKESNLDNYKKKINHVFFYGAGCSSKENKNVIKIPLMQFFTNAKIKISHDLEAACYAVYNGNPNITCILGTGSNSCFYDGEKIIESAPSLGFILGDEASGSYFGKKTLSLYFNNKMPKQLQKVLKEGFETDINIINTNIYKESRANVFLAKYFPFIVEKKNHPLIKNIITEALDDFINLNIKSYPNYKSLEVNFVGSVAFFLSKEIYAASERNMFKIGKILRHPIKGLVNFHNQKRT